MRCAYSIGSDMPVRNMNTAPTFSGTVKFKLMKGGMSMIVPTESSTQKSQKGYEK